MHRKPLTQKLKDYNPESVAEQQFKIEMLQFISEHDDCFERSQLKGHITGSAWIVNADRTKALLTHHAKLDRWLQPGGHADGEPDIVKVAMTEAEEETGLKNLRLVSAAIFDIDIHTIPARKSDPEHLHYDARFLLEADENESLQITHESKDLQWIPLNKLKQMTDENDSILRMAHKSRLA